MGHKRAHIGWGFWFQWMLATTAGLAVGGIVSAVVTALGLAVARIVGDVVTALGLAVGEAMGGIVGLALYIIGLALDGIPIGVMVGTMQWLILRRQVPSLSRWVLVTTVGLALGFFALPLVGAVVGVMQWLVLRQRVSRAGWWVLASTVGWGVGWGMVLLAASAFGGLAGEGNVLPLVVSGLVSAAVPGAVTGIALVWLLRHPIPEA